MQKLFACLVVLSLFLLLAAGCSTEDSAEADGYNFPDYVMEANHPGAGDAYKYAVDNREYLEFIPCYCNCYVDPFNHRNVKDCFINNEHSDSETIVYDPHGAG